MKSKNFKPDADFEREKFRELIDLIRKSKDEKLSADFDERFYSELKKVKINPPILFKIKKFIRDTISSFVSFKYRYYLVFSTVIIFILVVSYLIFRNSHLNKTINTENITNNNVKSENDLLKIKTQTKDSIFDQDSVLKTKNSKYWKDLALDVNKNKNFSFLSEVSDTEIKRIVQSKNFIEKTKFMKNPARIDTIKTILILIK